MYRFASTLIAVGFAATASMAQQTPDERKERVIIDLTVPPPEPEPDPVLLQKCQEEADAARISGEIVVCRTRPDDLQGVWDAEGWERDYAERTQGPRQPNVDGSGIKLPTEGSVFTVTVTVKTGEPPPPALIIDVEALPEAPPGSDADRIGRGLEPEAVPER